MAPLTSFYSRIGFITITTFLILYPALPSASAATIPQHQRPFKKIYAFGDSFTDTGNTRSDTGPSGFNHVSSLPYGSTFFHRPTNRYSDGRLVIDFAAEALSLPYLPPYLDRKADKSTGVNFAVGGATAIRHKFFVKNNLSLAITPQSLQTQLKWFDQFLQAQGCKGATTISQCEAAMDDALFWVGEIGVNDYAYTIGSLVAGATIQRLAINTVTGFLRELLTKGAKYIVVQGLPTTGCLPLAMVLTSEDDRDDIGCTASVNQQSHTHNAMLQSKLQALRTEFPRAVIIYADYWNAYRSIMKNVGRYRFKEPFEVCCGSGGPPYNFDFFNTCGSQSSSSCTNPSQYINWDGVHLTEAMYKAVSDLFLNGTFCTPPFEYLLSKKKRAAGMH